MKYGQKPYIYGIGKCSAFLCLMSHHLYVLAKMGKSNKLSALWSILLRSHEAIMFEISLIDIQCLHYINSGNDQTFLFKQIYIAPKF